MFHKYFLICSVIFANQITHTSISQVFNVEQASMNIDLTPTEKTALKQDNILMKMVVKLNTINYTNNVSTTDIFPDAVAIPNMLY